MKWLVKFVWSFPTEALRGHFEFSLLLSKRVFFFFIVIPVQIFLFHPERLPQVEK